MVELDPPPAAQHAEPAWLLAFTDVVSLVLTFFILMFAMSTLDVEAWRRVTGGEATLPTPPMAERNIATVHRRAAVDIDYLNVLLQGTLAKQPALAGAKLELGHDRIVLSLPSRLTFAPGASTLDAAAGEALFHLGGLLANLGNRVAVVGAAGPVSFELALARAAAVANALRRAGAVRSLEVKAAIGVGGALPADRVDLVILPGAAS
ncbi:MAG: hypothetical protein HQL39_18095 [Alphaproteobacteria bacterium]|nr:hypothetical protein [Alphaproteobacteria bacterium]